MATRTLSLRLLVALLGVVLVHGLGGCSTGMTFSSDSKVAFSNVSDTWVNVRFFVSNPEATTTPGTSFVSDKRLQVRPGATVEYALSKNPNFVSGGHNVVHVQVMPVAPSWDTEAEQYWLELLTHPPVTIVATGKAGSLQFEAGEGAVAQIPSREIRQGRFEHQMVIAPESDAPGR